MFLNRSKAVALFCLSLIMAACGGSETGSQKDIQEVVQPTDVVSGEDTPNIGVDTVIEPEDTTLQVDTFVPPPVCTLDQECDDDNPCTRDTCLDAECFYQDLDIACDDGNLCTSEDHCEAGACVGEEMACDDNNPCTVDKCKDGECGFKISDDEACALSVEITYPPKGGTLWENRILQVTGRVNAPAGLVNQVTVGGITLDVDAYGDFSRPMEAMVGLNIVEAEVQDGYGRRAKTSNGFLFGEDILTPGAPGDPQLLEAASHIWLARDVFDDDDINDLDDLSTFVWVVLENLDLNEIIPHPLMPKDGSSDFLWCDYSLDVDNISFELYQLDVLPSAGGLFLDAKFRDLQADFDAAAAFCPDAQGTMYADSISMEAKILVSLSPDGDFELDVAWVNVEVEGINIDMTGGSAQLLEWLADWMSGSLAEMIEDNLESLLPEQVFPMLREIFDSITSYEVPIQLPPLPGNIVELPVLLTVAPRSLEMSSNGALVTMNLGAASQKASEHLSPGSILRGSCNGQDPGVFELPGYDNMEASVNEDLINQILFSLWWGGHLNITITQELIGDAMDGLGITDLVIKLDPHLPPVMTTCTPTRDLEIQLGALQVDASFKMNGNPGEARIMANTQIGVKPFLELGEDGLNMIGLNITDVRALTAEVTESSGIVEGSESLIEALVNTAVVDLLVGNFLSNILKAYPIPEIDLGMVPGIPEGTMVTFNPKTVDTVLGYILLGGEVVNK